MLLRPTLAALTICLGAPSWADSLTKSGEFNCVKVGDIASLSGQIGAALINNLNISEGQSFLNGALYELRLSYAVANRTGVPVYASVDAIFEDRDGKPIAAISASPPFGSVAAGKTEAIERATITNQGTIGIIETICVRMAGAVSTR